MSNSNGLKQLQIQNMPIGIIQWSPEFRVNAWNRAAEQIFGFKAKEVLGKHAYELIVPPKTQPHVDLIFKLLFKSDAAAHSINENITKNGRRVICAWTNIPLKQENVITGVLSFVQDVTQHKLHDEEVNKLNTLLQTLRAIDKALLIAKDEGELFQKICSLLFDLRGISFAWVGLKQTDFTVKPVAWAGVKESFLKRLNVRWDESKEAQGLMGTAIRTMKQVRVFDVMNDPRLAPWRRELKKNNIQSAIALPLIHDNETIGALGIYSVFENFFGEKESNLLNSIAEDIALSIKSLRLGVELQSTLNVLDIVKKSLNSTVQAIATMGELRDPYTAGHERRVAKLSCAIAQELGLSTERIEGIRIMGYLHDIGKIAIPIEILSKPTKLSEAELSLIKTHPHVGYEILKDLDFPWPVAEVVLQHHERMDGSGYPRGLRGEEILLETRILSVSDVVESMVGYRPYQPALGLDKALLELLAHKHRLYDPNVVDACVKLFAENKFKL